MTDPKHAELKKKIMLDAARKANEDQRKMMVMGESELKYRIEKHMVNKCVCSCHSNLSDRILKEVSDTVKGCLGDRKVTQKNTPDCECCQRNAGWNERLDDITRRLKDAGVLID